MSPVRRGVRRFAIALAVLAGLVAALLGVIDSDAGHRLIAERVSAVKPASGLRFRIGRIDGSIYGCAVLRGISVSDPEGLVFAAPEVRLDWRPLRWFANRLDVRSLVIPQATLAKLPHTIPSGKQGPILPGFDIAIGELRVDRLDVGPTVTGVARSGRMVARADIRSGRALIDLDAVVAGSDRLRLKLDAEPDRDGFDLDVHARGAGGGVLGRLLGTGKSVAVDVAGAGRWARWDGTGAATIGGARIADLTLGNRAGRYALGGSIAPESITSGKLQRLGSPRMTVNGSATFASRRLDGALSLRSRAVAVDAEGVVDLAGSAWRNLQLSATLLRPEALFPNMTGRNIRLRAILDGAFATARFDYRLLADRFAFDDTGFEEARAAGSGRFSKAPVLVPLRFTARRVTGVGDVAGGILRNLSVDGVLHVTPALVTGNDLRLRSDKLTSRIMLTLDLKTGKFEVGVNGQLGRYEIPGLGLVDVASQLRVVPGPGGHGTRIVGTGTAQMLRLDNGFFRSLAGGLPRIVTGLERTPDGILHFTNLVLTGPAIRLTGTGYRRRDGTFHFEGGGTQQTYGPLKLVLDGPIEKPVVDLVFDRPADALGLKAVRAHLQPTPAGFAFAAQGGSTLGAFTGQGDILLPKGGDAVIHVARLAVSGTNASGDLRIVEGGFAGTIGFAGGGLGGSLVFAPAGTIQRIDVTVAATDAKLGQVATVRRARLQAVLLLDPAGTSIEATANGLGLSRGALRVARFGGSASLKGGLGVVRLGISGSRGRVFDLQTVTQVTTDGYSIAGQGTLDRRPLKLLTSAVLTRDGAGWRLSPARLAFAGGEAQVSGRFGGAATALDASLQRMPLSVLDIGYPGLGLGGVATGTLRYQDEGGAPTGTIDMTVRGLSRSGLVLSSQPIDIGVAGVLRADRAGLRAVMATGGRTVGRAQAMLTPLGTGGLAQRLAAAPLFAQLRYTGPADTLWRLTGIELFDLSGPVGVAADVGGRLADPVIRGSLRTETARIESNVTGTVLTNVRTSGRFGGSQLVIDSFAADAGKGGRVTGTGRFDLSSARGFGIDLKLQADHAVMISRDDIGATVSGPITIRSAGAGGVIGGDVRLDASRFLLGQATAATSVPKLAVREINLPDTAGEVDDVPTQPWRLDLHARAPDGLRVTGLGLQSEWSADLRITGEPEVPVIAGRADLIRGDYEFAGRSFELARGAIRFDGSVPADPALDIAANADAQGLSATIRVTGTGAKPEIAFSSVPALPEDELLSRLLFGTSITNLSAPEALQLAAAVAALQNGGNGLNPINAVRRAAGLDRLRILPADVSTGQGTSVAAGKYITRRLFAEIVTDGQGYSATEVEFQVTRWLALLSSISTLGRQSVNVRVSKDY